MKHVRLQKISIGDIVAGNLLVVHDGDSHDGNSHFRIVEIKENQVIYILNGDSHKRAVNIPNFIGYINSFGGALKEIDINLELEAG